MAAYVYCPHRSIGAVELADSLEIQRVRRFDGESFWNKNRKIDFDSKDLVICWGSFLPDMEEIRVLNSPKLLLNRHQEFGILSSKKVPCLESFGRKSLFPAKKLLARSFSGSSLLGPLESPDYWVSKETFVREYRLHSFLGKTIRSGIKVPREGFQETPEELWKPGLLHPWIRSFAGGWRVKYDDFKPDERLRKPAALAIKALGLSFGAVDLGEMPDGTFKVIKVDRAPVLEAGTLGSYVKHISLWIKAQEAHDDAGRDGSRVAEENNPF